jgi:hypothetical protein
LPGASLSWSHELRDRQENLSASTDSATYLREMPESEAQRYSNATRDFLTSDALPSFIKIIL